MGVVTEGIIAMPYELAMADELTRMQFYQTVTSEIATLRARLETVEAETRERLSNELDPEIGLPSDARLRNIHADLEMRGRKHPDFAVTVHHRNIVLSAVAAELRNLEPRHD